MPENRDDWSDIGVTSGSRTERRADPNHPLDFFRARSPEGNYMLVLKGAEISENLKLPVLSGLAISSHAPQNRPAELVVELLDSEQTSIFRALAADLLFATNDVAQGDGVAGAARVITRIERWQDLLKKRRDQLLSRQAIIGLFGELHFLKERILPRMQPVDAVAAWRGPHGEEQDFAIGEWIVEVKTQLSTADQFLKISSEAQLDTASGPIVICHQTFASASTGEPNALSLNGIVETIRTELLNAQASALDLFEAGLMAAGFETRQEYEREGWMFVKASLFEVVDDFPRLVPQMLPPGVQRVTYRIIPAACSDYARSEDWLSEKVFYG